MPPLYAVRDEDESDAMPPAAAASPEKYTPQSPFLSEPAYSAPALTSEATALGSRAAEPEAMQSPFLSAYSLEGGGFESHEAALYRELLDDLYDFEFDEAVEDLVNDVRAVYETRFSGEVAPDAGRVEREMALYVAPLLEAVENALDRLADESAAIDGETLTEAALDRFLDETNFEVELGNPVFENFFGKMFKKLKKVAKKGFNAIQKGVRKGIQFVKKLNPLNFIFSKLKKLVRPLLKRVIKFGIKKLPARFRPLARKLARRFLRETSGEQEALTSGQFFELQDRITRSEALAEDAEAASPASEIISTEFDALFAGLVIEGEDFELEPAFIAFVEGEGGPEDQGRALDHARDRFVSEIIELEDGTEPTVQVERFIPAILAGLKLGLKLIGRRRVVNFLAKYLARLIKRFVGKRAAKPLSRALVDAGLKLVNLENPEELEYATGEVLAQTIQETVETLAESLPEEALDDEALLELYVQDAFEAAARRNFPPAILRARLRAPGARDGMWQLFPAGRGRKLCKKFSRSFEVSLPPGAADEILTFGGETLGEFLDERLAHPAWDRPVAGTMHLYEAIDGTNLAAVSRVERGVGGLGTSERAAWSQFHPLTREAAAVLLPATPGLASEAPRRFLADRGRIGVGQRFYYLEIPGARMTRARVSRTGAPARSSDVRVTVDFARKAISLQAYLSEAVSVSVVRQLREEGSSRAALAAIRKLLTARLPAALSGRSGSRVDIRREQPAEEDFVARLGSAMRLASSALARRLAEAAVAGVSRQLRDGAFVEKFVAAVDDAADGVTITIRMREIDLVFAVLRGTPVEQAGALARLRGGAALKSAVDVEFRAGYFEG